MVNTDIREAAATLNGVTRIEAENVIAALIANKCIRKSDMDEVRFAKDRLFSDISGLEKIEVDDNVKDVGGLRDFANGLMRKRNSLHQKRKINYVQKGCSHRGGSYLLVCLDVENRYQQNLYQQLGSCRFTDWILQLYREAMLVSQNSN